MRNRAKVLTLSMLAVSLPLGLAAQARAADERFSLMNAIPDDAFFCVGWQHNPERAFVDDYWNEVFDAFKQTGVCTDVLEMIGGSMNPEDKEQFDQVKQWALDLIDGVNWDELDAKEGAFAIRMPDVVVRGDNVSAGGPDFVVMFRGTTEGAEKNFTGLVNLVEGVLEKFGGGIMVPVKSERNGASLLTMVGMSAEQGGPYSVDIARRDDVIVISAGKSINAEVLDLLAGSGQAKPMSKNQRFQAAFQSLPQAEDCVAFFDMQLMIADLRGITDSVFKAMGGEGGREVIAEGPQTAEAKALFGRSMGAYNERDYTQAVELMLQANAAEPGNGLIMYNTACFQALSGNKAEALEWLSKAVEAGFAAPNKIKGDSDLDSLHDDPKFMAVVGRATDLAKDQPATGNNAEMQMVKVLVDKLYGLAGMMDYAASVEYTDGHVTKMDEACVLTDDAMSHPFYPVFGGRAPLEDYKRFLPQETKSFSVESGIDLTALYAYVKDTINDLGPEGQQAWAQWEAMQEQNDFNLQRDVLGWVQGDVISVSYSPPGGGGLAGDNWAMFVKVHDGQMAKEKVAQGIDLISSFMGQFAEGNPMGAMMAIRTSPANHEKLEGFQNISMGMMPQPMVWGVAEGYLVFGANADTVVTCLETASGQHPDVTKNEQVMAEAILPDGKFNSVSLTDYRNIGREIGQGLQMLSMMGGMATMAIPDVDARRIVTRSLGILAKLGPVATKVDFFKSAAACTTFDGKTMYTKSAVNYFSPSERPSAGG